MTQDSRWMRILTKPAVRLAAFGGALILIGGAAAIVGRATDASPFFGDCLEAAAADAGVDVADDAESHGGGGEPIVRPVPGADGLRAELAGVRIQPEPQDFEPGSSAAWQFGIVGCDGAPVRDFEPEQGKLLHLIVVRSDLTGYQHLHPKLEPKGTFSTTIATPSAGRYRAIADFVIDGRKYVVGTDLVVPGGGRDAPLPAPDPTRSTDGYDIELQRPAVVEAGEEAQLTFRVTRRGRPVTHLEPYLGAYGHLVALHAGDLAYSHVHPNGEDRAAGAITFDVEFEEPGRYRLFLQFQTRGRVHTVAFTETVT